MSPSRSCLTDTELLRSPTEVLYAVSDKQQQRQQQQQQPNNNSLYSSHHNTQIQQPQAELNPYLQHQNRQDRQSRQRSVASSREDLLYAHLPSASEKHPGRSSSEHLNSQQNHHQSRFVSIHNVLWNKGENKFCEAIPLKFENESIFGSSYTDTRILKCKEFVFHCL